MRACGPNHKVRMKIKKTGLAQLGCQSHASMKMKKSAPAEAMGYISSWEPERQAESPG